MKLPSYDVEGGQHNISYDEFTHNSPTQVAFNPGSPTKVPTKWIQKAIQKPGSLRATAKKKGLIKGEEKLTSSDLSKLEKSGGKTAKRARLARTLKGLNK